MNKIFQLFSAITHSIFLKFVLILLLTGFSVIFFVGVFFRLQFDPTIKIILNKNIHNYFTYLAREIGSPPDTSRAMALANEFSITVIYENGERQWSTPLQSIPVEKIRRPRFMRRHTTQWIDRQSFIVNNADGSRFIFRMNYSLFLERHEEKLSLLLLILSIIFFLNYVVVRNLLTPIKLLKNGVQQLGAGNLQHQIAVTRKDELGELSHSFNEMARRIQEMIQSREQLLLDVSHELRSPITRMKIALELMPDNKQKMNIANDIREMETMITEILETERLKNGEGKLQLHHTDIVAIMKEVADHFHDRAPGIKLLQFPQTSFLEMDSERIKIVLNNILENAIKYALADSQPIEISLLEEKNAVVIQISDDGGGIPEEHLPYIFTPFYRVDKSRSKVTGGYGLGLSLCKKIIEAHHGMIEIVNNEKRGITVRIFLPKIFILL